MNTLTGKVALVTGGSRGIGAGIVRALAANGADVAFTYVTSHEKADALANEIRTMGRKATAINADAANAEQIIAAVERTASEFGRLDILVNNAGNFVTGNVEQLTLADFDRSMCVNVRAVFAAILQASRHLPEHGRIITIGSCLASYAGRGGISMYTTSKAALVGLTKGVARDLGHRQITVNLLQPGSINTDMNPSDSERAPAALAKMALPAYGEPADIAAAVVYLAGEGGRFVTGATLDIDGGINA
ncbi:SDR family NAD(P)-dependent oxidoreductase [Serratia sp. AKBS12]|uniref:SDR family NAD(P)-dependent oxidoreductase n=1 Tax=Serratia sp. AKBS12 TaxID=2974597 RepID=UPI002165A7CE|nr:SDR family oxidoreductase [Serratia sp. AKBS12]MCS3406726.1 SDR family oxidoreductase [Serratia sp. AKBS12]